MAAAGVKDDLRQKQFAEDVPQMGRLLSDNHPVRHPRLHAFARHWGFQVKACAPYRARTKGKDERGVGDVKRNAIAGWSFDSFEALEAHLERWSRNIADQRVHGTTGEAPAARFARDEASALRPLPSCGPFVATRELSHRVSADCAVEVDTNAYSVPWRLIGERVRVLVAADTVSVTHAGVEVAQHRRSAGRRGRIVDRAHFIGRRRGWRGRTPPGAA